MQKYRAIVTANLLFCYRKDKNLAWLKNEAAGGVGSSIIGDYKIYFCKIPDNHLIIGDFRLAEREGFEPPVPCSTTVFKTAAIDHSAISPLLVGLPF